MSDYAGRTTLHELKSALADETVAGAVAVGPGSSGACIEILSRCKGNRFVAGYCRALPAITVMEGGLATIPQALHRRRSGVRNTKVVVVR